jgi:hypothetical protein
MADTIERPGKILAAVLAVIALVFVAPDFIRVFVSYPTLGFDVDNNGRIYNVTEETSSSMKSCQRIDLDGTDFKTLVAIFGGMGGRQYVSPALSEIKLQAYCDNNPTPQEKKFAPVAAKPSVSKFIGRLMLLAEEIVAVLIIWFGLKSVGQRPYLATFGFFLYIIWFNPGQTFVVYSLAQNWPPAVLVLETLQAVLAGLGYWGFIIFALYFRAQTLEKGWPVTVNRIAPLLAFLFVILQLWTFATPFGFQTEWAAQMCFVVGFVVDALVVSIVWRRLRSLQFDNHQKAVWVFVGCIVGLTAYLIADVNASTSLLVEWWNPSDNTLSVLYLINGFLAYAILTPILRERVLDPRFALSRNAVLVITLIVLLSIVVVPISLFEEYIREHIFDNAGDPASKTQLIQALQFAIYLPCVALVTYFVHHWAVHINGFVDYYLFPKRRKALHDLRIAAERLEEHVTDPREVDRELVDNPAASSSLAWAAIFKKQNGEFQRDRMFRGLLGTEEPPGPTQEWVDKFARGRAWTPLQITDASELTDTTAHGIRLPALATPIRSAGTVIAIVFYGAHKGGDDIDEDERRALGELAHAASIAYQKVRRESLQAEIRDLRQRLSQIQQQLAGMKTQPGPIAPSSPSSTSGS